MVEERRYFVQLERDGPTWELGTDEMDAFVRPWIEKMVPETVYVVTYHGPKVKRTVTGKYVSHDLTDVILLTEGGRFNRVPINRIFRMNYYLEGKEPF